MWTDVPDEDFAVPGDEQFIQAEVAKNEAPAEEAPAEVPAEEEAPVEAEKPRDEQGRFVAEAPAEELILGKFKSHEDLQAAYEALEKRSGETSAELGELRQLRETLEERLPEQAPQQYDLNAVIDALDENPARIPQVAIAAYQDGDEDMLDAAIVAWENHDQIGAKRFQREIMLDRLRKEQTTVQTQQTQQRNGWQETAKEFATEHPDFDRLRPAMLELHSEFPEVVGLLASDTPSVRKQVLGFLYTEAQRRESDNATAQTREATKANDASAERAIEEASVVSGTSAHTETQKTGAELVGEQWDALDSALDAGWQV